MQQRQLPRGGRSEVAQRMNRHQLGDAKGGLEAEGPVVEGLNEKMGHLRGQKGN